VESRLLGFPPFPYSFISMACFGNRSRSHNHREGRFFEQETLVPDGALWQIALISFVDE
jgi:hypothetical protein